MASLVAVNAASVTVVIHAGKLFLTFHTGHWAGSKRNSKGGANHKSPG